ncbi:YjbH domain-containing protein [Yoonia litorea]|uniref:Exopolysaccharide biosynthesis protein YbjH n=1 Tax=Yoonia litorea TaxID=1123755 RepID=A0A1I6MWS3_9RHOB|nr:YjbH domain-containing protein [Yoonia litorea]SFS20163.1 Exopolysaccharide biosynthesis protein YbjH [Yoonia litorea]
MRISVLSSASVIAVSLVSPTNAQDIPPTFGLYGTPGLLEMPTASTPSEGTIATSLSYRDGLFQTVLSYQLTERISGSFRLALMDIYDETATDILRNEFERGFDLHIKLVEESAYLPEVSVGLRDFLTPGKLQSEYIVATKSIGDGLRVSAGVGWGAMGTRDGFENPISARAIRPAFDVSESDGQLANDFWFAGDAAFFGGVEYQWNDRWGLVAEYSSLAYPESANSPAIDAESPYSFGLTYRPRDGMQFTAAALNRDAFAISGSFFLNANKRPGMSGIESAPVPVRVRSAAERSPAARVQLPPTAIGAALAPAFEVEGLQLLAIDIEDDTARIRFSNERYRSNAQALGRAARLLTQVMPAQVETFFMEQVSQGIPLSAVRVSRRDIEILENRAGAARTLLARASFQDAETAGGLTTIGTADPELVWGLSPYFRIVPSSSGGTASVDIGASLDASYAITPQLVLSGSIQQSLLRNDAEDPVADDTPELQNVRTDGGFYGDDGVPVLQRLALTHFGRPAENLYSRISVGYLERMFGGVSAELLWKPVNGRLGLGAEVSYVAQRDTDLLLGFEDYDYQVTTGHLSAYYDFGNGYHTQLDVGRYLAGDWGATLEVAREYENGIRIAASVTQTDVSYDDFGTGSYNKGISITLPQDFLTGRATRETYSATLGTRTGDGGARLEIGDRLYSVVRGAHQADLSDTWGRFWR